MSLSTCFQCFEKKLFHSGSKVKFSIFPFFTINSLYSGVLATLCHVNDINRPKLGSGTKPVVNLQYFLMILILNLNTHLELPLHKMQ